MEKEVEQYIETATDERKTLYEKLQSLIIGLYPDARVAMSAQIPTYRTKSGWIALGYTEDGVSLYTDGPQHLIEFKKLNPNIDGGKSVLKFKSTDEIPESDVSLVVKHALDPQDQPNRNPSGRR